jgi:hypothetical protein
VLIPLVRRDANILRELLGLGLFVLGAVVGGLTVGAGVLVLNGLVSWLPLLPRVVVFAMVCALLAGHELRLYSVPLYQQHRMIPPGRFERSILAGIFLFAFELGVGFRTYIPHVAPFVLASAGWLILDDPLAVALVAVGWGSGRAFALMVRFLGVFLHEDADVDRGIELMARLDELVSRSGAHTAKAHLITAFVLCADLVLM